MSVDDVINEAKARLEPLLSPINGGVGDDISYDEAFETIKTEIDKHNAIEGGVTEWPAVLSNAEALLTDKSKDFRLALFWAAARAQAEGLTGFFDGLVLVHGLSEAFWEPMYPALKRPRARGNLLLWFGELCTPIIQNANPTPQQRKVVDASDKLFSHLDGFFADKLGEAYPGMLSLRDAMRGLTMRAPQEAPPPPPPGAAAEGGFAHDPGTTPVDGVPAAPAYAQEGLAAPAGLGISAADVVDPESAYRALSEMAPLVARAADVMLGVNPASADGQRLSRLAAWLLVGGEPYHEGGQTQIDGPREHVVQALADLAAAQDWTSLGGTAAQIAAEYPLYLDAVRFLATAYENLGPDYDLARRVVEMETAALLARAPQLPALRFADGTPFANADTQAWASRLGAGGGGTAVGGRSPVDKAVAEADKLAAADQLPQAIAVLSRVASQASPVHRFRARMEIAKLAMRFSLLDIARAQLEGLERVAEEHRLAAWDPELCAEMYANLYRVRRAKAAEGIDDAELPKRISQAFERLCELDAAQAFRVQQEG